MCVRGRKVVEWCLGRRCGGRGVERIQSENEEEETRQEKKQEEEEVKERGKGGKGGGGGSEVAGA
jgi:hypothetical protein